MRTQGWGNRGKDTDTGEGEGKGKDTGSTTII
jgi:hypothetical protein